MKFNIHNILTSLEKPHLRANVADVRVGDTVRVHYKIKEGNKERVQVYEGLVVGLKGGKSLQGSFVVRKISYGVGVERTFPLHSPWIVKIERTKTGKVRRAKLNFVRNYAMSSKFKLKDKGKAGTVWEDMVVEPTAEDTTVSPEETPQTEETTPETAEPTVEIPEDTKGVEKTNDKNAGPEATAEATQLETKTVDEK